MSNVEFCSGGSEFVGSTYAKVDWLVIDVVKPLAKGVRNATVVFRQHG